MNKLEVNLCKEIVNEFIALPDNYQLQSSSDCKVRVIKQLIILYRGLPNLKESQYYFYSANIIKSIDKINTSELIGMVNNYRETMKEYARKYYGECTCLTNEIKNLQVKIDYENHSKNCISTEKI